MNLFSIPARNDTAWYRFKISLSGVVYTLRFRYNTRMQRWIMDIADATNNNIVVGVPVRINMDLFGRFAENGLPVGTLFVSDNTGGSSEPVRDSFGKDHTLLYADPASFP